MDEDVGREGAWKCGYTALVQTPLILLFNKQFVTPLVSQGFTSEGKRKACGLLCLLSFYSFYSHGANILLIPHFKNSLQVRAVGEAMCENLWGTPACSTCSSFHSNSFPDLGVWSHCESQLRELLKT